MDQSQIYSVARAAGLPDARAKVAAAIAMAESGGDPNKHNTKPPDDSYGLWQINMLGSLGPSRRALYGLKANSDLFDPATNARVMSAISAQGSNFSAWTTYTSGKYKQFLGASVTDVAGAAANGLIPGAGGLVSGVGDAVQAASVFPAAVVDTFARAGDALTRSARWISNQHNWLRVGYVIGGGALVLTAVRIVAAPAVARAAGQVAGVVSPVKKITKGVTR